MIPSNPVGSGANNPSYVDIDLSQGSHSIEFRWLAYDWGNLLWYIADTETKNVTVKFNIYTSNIFGAGSVLVDGVSRSSGYAKQVIGGNSIGIGAIEQSYNGYNWVWSTTGSNTSKWVRKQDGNTYISTSQSTTYAVASNDNSATLEAGLRKLCDATFSNSFSGGVISINGNAQNSPASTQVVEANTVTVTAQQSYENFNNSGLDYSFSNWDGGSTSLSKTFTIYNHEQHTAYYVRRANTSQVFEWDFTNVAVGNNIRLTWNEHPNTNVTQYKIWRRDKNGTESYIGTVNRGTTSFTDYDYQYASENDPDKGTLFYNVSVYCSLDGGSWSSDGMKLVT
jgi:plastocyanin